MSRPLDPIPRILQRGTLNLLGGSSGIGKSAFIASVACALRDGTSLFGHKISGPCELGCITADRPEEPGESWFDVAGFSNMRQYCFTRDTSITDKELANKDQRVALFTRLVEKLELPDGGILIVDPLSQFLGGNLNDYDRVGRACRSIHQYLIKRQICLIALMHASKIKADPKDRYLNIFDRILGSSALLGFANTQMQLLGPEQSKSGLYEFHWNPHHHPREMFTLKRNELGLFLPAGDDSVAQMARKPVPRQCQPLYTVFPESPATMTVLEVEALFPDTNRATIFRWLGLLTGLAYLTKTDKGVYQKAKA